MDDFSDDKVELLQRCATCESYKPAHRMKRYWILTILIHGGLLILMMFLLVLYHTSTPQSQARHPFPATLADHDAHLIGTISSPLNDHAKHIVQNLPADNWNAELYFGEPTYDSDNAWNSLIYPRSFRLSREEAQRLNMTDSVRVTPGEDFGTMLGVYHNLHCLRRIRQIMYPNYYYPDASMEELEYNRNHSFHCLESIRSSVTCYPDLNPHPYYWSGNKYHPVTVSAKVSRTCTDWKALQELLEPRNFESKKLMKNTGPSS